MKYSLELRSIAVESDPIEQKHSRFLNGIAGLVAPWGLANRVPAPHPGSSYAASFNVSKVLGKGLKGNVFYALRRPFADHARCDDFVDISFNSAKINYQQLIDDVFLNYVTAFEAYFACVSDDEFIYRDDKAVRAAGGNKRNSVYRIPPVGYFSERLCRSAFGMSPSDVVLRLDGKVEVVRETAGGVYLVLTREVMDTDSLDKVCWEANRNLRPTLAIRQGL